MYSTQDLPGALVVSGDARIADLLARERTIVIPAYACRLDGFVNDTFTEYANPSIYRPASVCRARLVSTLQEVVRATGNYYLGFTMYAAAGYDEPVEMWIGHRPVARAHLEMGDHRLHLFVVPERFRFRNGERIRLITGATDGPYRIEKIVLLPRRPRPAKARLEIRHPHVDLTWEGDRVQVRITWITNHPAKGYLRWRKTGEMSHQRPIRTPAVNHEVVLKDLEVGADYAYEIQLQDEIGSREAAHSDTFRTDMAPPQSRVRRASFPHGPQGISRGQCHDLGQSAKRRRALGRGPRGADC